MIKNNLTIAVFVSTFGFAFAQEHEVIHDMPAGDYAKKEFTADEINLVEKNSDDFSGMPKIIAVNEANPNGVESETEKWPEGAWGRGYATWPNMVLYTKTAYGYFACKPLIRDVSCFTRGHLFLYLDNNSLTTSLRLVKAGIDYLLDEQIKEGKEKGAYMWWLNRESDTSLNMNAPINKTQPYETTYALVALCDFYRSGIDYRRDEIKIAIELSAKHLEKINWKKSSKVNNSNMRSLGIWSLAAVYQVTGDEKMYDKAVEIAEMIIDMQRVDSTSENGLWYTGGVDQVDNYRIYHDTKIYYHCMILRGLIEAFEIVPDDETELKWKIADAMKRGLNHLIDYRVDRSNSKNYKLRYASKTENGEQMPDWFSHELIDFDKVLEPIVKIAYYSKNSPYFTEQEHQNLLKLAYQIGYGLNATEKWYTPTIGMYQYYIGSVLSNRNVFTN
ncbi:MAG: AGE family epimerase/isomerase [Crocinitomicaceae bacterium]|nr:AGE family epimerase/isomerase [Crocinitomicaceae bacterium]MBK8926019.1 AGE family epimerase/isomerase [Crocinitomicaceae bacterium]